MAHTTPDTAPDPRIPLTARLRAAVRGRRTGRGAAELSVLAVLASLVTGVFFGSGISNTAVDIADGLTWIGDGPSGEVIQVNPATGRPQLRLKVAQPGADLSLAQYDGRMFVTNHTTGELQSFDLSRVLRSAARRVTQGEVVDTLVRDGELYLVDRSQSTISRLDPVTLDELGTVWTSSAGLADAALDGQGDIWALEDDGDLHTLRWSEPAGAFDETADRTVDLSGPGSVLVAHDTGVTVFGPDQGIVQQVGTTHDQENDAPRLGGELRAPEKTPADLVPVSAPSTGTVVLTTPAGVIEVDVAAVGCGDPGTPEVYEGVVYVPCLGDAKVIRLGRDGRRVLPDIETPGTADPELVLDDGSLIVNTPGAPTGAVVDSGGAVGDLVRYDDSIPAIVPGTTDDPPPAKAPGLVSSILSALDPGKDTSKDTGKDPGRDPGKPKPDPSPPTPSGLPSGLPTGTAGGNQNGGGVTPAPGLPTTLPSGGLPLVPSPTTPAGPGARPTPETSPSATPTATPTSRPSPTPSTPPATPTSPATPTPSPTPTPVTVAAPTGVSAEGVSANQIRISWTHEGADQFIVSRASGGDVATVPGSNRQATVSVQPGVANSYVVTAVKGGQKATSAPTSQVTTTDRPGTPPSVAGTATYTSRTAFKVDVTWGATATNGSPVTSYEVSVQTPDGTKRLTTAGDGRSTTASWTCTAANCNVGGAWSVSVVAVNSVGRSNAGQANGPAPARPDPPLPAAGRDLVSGQDTTALGVEGEGTTTLSLAPPSDWSSFTGTCSYVYEGNTSAIGCNARSLDVAIHTGVIREPGSGQVSHQITFMAANNNGEVRSATYTWTTQQQTLCENCQIP